MNATAQHPAMPLAMTATSQLEPLSVSQAAATAAATFTYGSVCVVTSLFGLAMLQNAPASVRLIFDNASRLSANPSLRHLYQAVQSNALMHRWPIATSSAVKQLI